MATRDPWAERYNRRTRAIEKGAHALTDIARSLEALAIAQAVNAGRDPNSPMVWEDAAARGFLVRLADRIKRF